MKRCWASRSAARMLGLLALGMILSGIAVTAPRAVQAQNIGDRTVSGTVQDASSSPVANATVFLRNEKSKTIRSYTSDNDGHYHFAQVNMAEDFDLWAEKGGHKSAVKTVSSWDARKEFVSDLKLK